MSMINLKKLQLRRYIITALAILSFSGLGDSADSAGGFPWPILLLGITIVLILITYSLHSENRKLKSELIRYRDFIRKQMTEKRIKEGMGQQKINVPMNQLPLGKLEEEPEEKKLISEIRGEQMRKRFWEKLEKSFEPEGESELEKLRAEKKRLDGMIELTKSKYHRREIDETGFKNIITEYQKQLIEIEAKIGKLEEKKNG